MKITPVIDRQVDLDTGVIVAAPIHPADQRDTATLPVVPPAVLARLGEPPFAARRRQRARG